jgi:hypothetical protein
MKYAFILLALGLLYGNQLQAQGNHFTKYSSQPELTQSVKQQISEIPFFQPLAKYTKDEVTYIDNSSSKFFPPIFNQKGNSCSQASGIRYMFTYHMNALRNIPSNSDNNIYSYHYTWNFLNQGTDMGSWSFDGYDLVMCNGAANLTDFPDDHFQVNERTWMSGYEKYHKAMHNKIESYYKIKSDENDGLEKIKQVLIDQGNDSDVGGLLNFSGKTTGWSMATYSGPSKTGYKSIITRFGNGGDHAMVIAGFDDNVEFDLNGDGEIHNDEKGALIIVNSWGSGWGDNGRAYMPYKLLKLGFWNGGIGNGDKYVYGIRATEHTPTVTAKVRISYSSRNDLWFILGVANNASAESQQRSRIPKVFNKQGGDYYMQGGPSDAHKVIEIGFDYTDLLNQYPDAKKFFLTVKQSPVGTLGDGVIISFTIIDNRDGGEPKEYESTQKNVSISGTNMLSVVTSTTSSFENSEAQNMSITVSPNPVKAGQILAMDIPSQTQVQTIHVNVYSPTGSLVYSRSNLAVDYGRAYITIPPNLLANIYFVETKANGRVWRNKFIVY